MTTHTAEPAAPMPDDTDVKLNLTKLGIGLAVVAASASLLGAWVVFPYRLDAAEAKLHALEARIEAQSGLLIRIDENVKQLKETTRR
jgi:hypothetical protein